MYTFVKRIYRRIFAYERIDFLADYLVYERRDIAVMIIKLITVDPAVLDNASHAYLA